MKKLLLALAGLVVLVSANAQSLEEIVKKYTEANRLNKISALKTIRITGNMSMMGTNLPLTMWMKNPDKIKTVTSFNGQDMIQVYDGQKGYIVNPMMGSAIPKEMTQEEIKQTLRSNIFQNYMAAYLKNGQLAMAGEDKVNNKPAFRIKATLEDGIIVDFLIDKSSFLMVKVTSTFSQNGTPIDVEAYPTDYREVNGLLLPMKTLTTAGGMEMEMVFTKVEVDIPMDDSIFRVN
jgi:outer membrane lipoprotein-sorting protein